MELVELRGYSGYWHGMAGGYSGVSLLLRDGVFEQAPVFTHPPFDMESRLVEARIGELFERMIGQGLSDIGRKLDPDNDRLFTWWPFWRSARERNLGWRLDYIFASESIAATAITSSVRRFVGTSDHAPVLATFDQSRIGADIT